MKTTGSKQWKPYRRRFLLAKADDMLTSCLLTEASFPLWVFLTVQCFFVEVSGN